MAHGLSEEQLTIFREAFSHFDKDGNGSITLEELRTVLHTLEDLREEFTDEKMEAMIKEIDVDGNGKVNYHEFMKLVTEL